jgi:hemerythrin-like domain-containing protein
MKITEALFAEHLVFHNLFDHLEKHLHKFKTLAELKTAVAVVDSALQLHSRTEDDLFIGPLGPSFEQIGQRETFHEEHEQIDQLMAEVQKAKQLNKARALLHATIVLCRNHFDKEERIVFPMAERVLKSKTLHELGQTWMNQRK